MLSCKMKFSFIEKIAEFSIIWENLPFSFSCYWSWVWMFKWVDPTRPNKQENKGAFYQKPSVLRIFLIRKKEYIFSFKLQNKRKNTILLYEETKKFS